MKGRITVKLGILVTIISGFGKKGFYQSQEVGLGKLLTERGHEVLIYKCVAEDQPADENQINARLSIRYIPVKSVGVHGIFPVNKLDTELDGLLCFSDTQIFLPHVIRFCEKNGIAFVPYVGIAHSAQKNLKSRVMDRIFAAGTLRYYKKMPVIAKSEGVRQELTELGITETVTAPVGLDENVLKLDYASYDRKTIRAGLGYTDQDVVISFVGRIKPEKSPIEAVEMFGRIRNRKPFKLLMVGEGFLLDDVRAKIAELGLNDRVQLIERVPYEDMWKIHWAADYFINLCTREIFGMALLESVLYRSSAAALRAPGPDTILEGMKGHALCNNFDEVAEWLTGDYPTTKDLAESSARLLERFSWKNCAERFEEFTERVRKAGKE